MRDSKGRFAKGQEGLKITMKVPTLTDMVYWVILVFIFMPWISLIFRLELLKRLLSFFDNLLSMSAGEKKEIKKKKDLFS